MKKKNGKIKAALIGTLVLGALVSTWAFFSAESRIENELYTKQYGADTIEKFKPKQKLEPGVKIEKEVGVKNTGDYDLVVRIKFEEEWVRDNAAFITFDSVDADGNFNNAIISAQRDEETGKVTATQIDEEDGSVTDDDSVMYKHLSGLTGEKWKKGNDGWFYYTEVLKPGASTELLLESLILAGNTDMGKYNTVEKYSQTQISIIEELEVVYNKAKKEYLDAQNTAEIEELAALKLTMDEAGQALEGAYDWKTDKPKDDQITFKKAESSIVKAASGYAGAEYTLTIVTQVCQATKDAVEENWNVKDTAILGAWKLQ